MSIKEAIKLAGYTIKDIRCAQVTLFEFNIPNEDDIMSFFKTQELGKIGLCEWYTKTEVNQFFKYLDNFDELTHFGGTYVQYIGRIDKPMEIKVWFKDGGYGHSSYTIIGENYAPTYTPLKIVKITTIPKKLLRP